MELIIALIFASTVSLALALMSVQARSGRRRLKQLANGTALQMRASARGRSMLARKEPGRLLRAVRALGRSSMKSQQDTKAPGLLRERLIRAGYRSESAPSVYMASRIIGALVTPLPILVTPALWTIDELRLAAILCGAAALGYIFPSWWVGRRTARRQHAIQRALPDALDMMVVCVEAGVGINASLARVSKEFAVSNPILSAEFELVTLEIRAGKSTTEALRALVDRTGVSDISSLVGLLVQTERFGTSVADALRVHADAIRVRRMQRAEEEAGKAPLKMIFPTVVIFLATMIVILTPAAIQFSHIFDK